MLVTQKVLDLFKERNIFFSMHETPRLKIGDSINLNSNIQIEPYTAFNAGNGLHSMGAFSYSWSQLGLNTVVGRYSSIAASVRLFGVQHPYERFSSSAIVYSSICNIAKSCSSQRENFSFQAVLAPGPKPITIGNDVWVGSHVALKPGITIHDGAVIATGAVVTKDIPPYAVAGGVPAKIIKMRFSDDIIEDMMSLKWWEYCFADFENIRADIDVREFIERIKMMISDGKIQKFEPEALTGEEILKVSE